MRLWSIHPRYLDARGLVAVWREGLLAKAVLSGQTRGYRNHPQLERFYQHPQPIAAIQFYLEQVAAEAAWRGYSFALAKIECGLSPQRIAVTAGQLQYEIDHLKHKLIKRDPTRLNKVDFQIPIEPNPLFYIIPGGVAAWEKSAMAQPN